ncbi:MAG: adenylate kinase [Candidatus Woesearchaeota archaeon]|nr:adenylate kinase [Candidatus Woesearchaeota archaeon]
MARLIFLGPPGAGKGTQAKILSKKLHIPHISTGDIFRENIKNQTELGKKASEYMNEGLLVPDEVTNDMLKERISRQDCKIGYVLDGYPRTIAQADFLSKISKIDRVINFMLADEEIIKRISGRRTCKTCGTPYNIEFMRPKKTGICDKCLTPLVQRDDEKPEIVKKRLEVYEAQTAPLIEYYQKKKLLVDIDAFPKIEEVALAVEKMI